MSLYPITILIVSMMYAHLYVKERFALGPASPIIFNLSIVIGLFYLYYVDHLSIIYLAWSVVIAGILQVLFLALNFKYKSKVKFFFKYSSAKKEYLLFLKTLWPAVLNVGFNQIDKLIGIAFASFTVGYVTYIYIAERIYSLPIELVGIPLATVLLTAVSSTKIESEVRKRVFLKSISFLIYLIIPASFGLFIISEELLSLFFERGKFTKESIILTNDLLRGFLIGLPAFTLVTTLNPYFFAIKKTKILFYCSFISSITNVVLLFSLYDKYGPLCIAISLSISKYVNLFLLIYQLKKLEINILSKNQIYNLITSLLFSIIMILVIIQLSYLIQSFGSDTIQTLILIISGFSTYLILTIILNNKFYNQMYNFLLNRKS